MKKTFFFNLIPTKAEEDTAKASNIPFQVSRVLVEIRDLYPPPPPPDTNSPWRIRKRVTTGEVVSGRLILSHTETFEYVFRYWTLDMANHVLGGNKAHVVVWDVTEMNNPIMYRNECMFLEKDFSDEFYVLGWIDLARSLLVSPGDEIGLYWDTRSGSFHFKLFHKLRITEKRFN